MSIVGSKSVVQFDEVAISRIRSGYEERQVLPLKSRLVKLIRLSIQLFVGFWLDLIVENVQKAQESSLAVMGDASEKVKPQSR